MSNSESTLPPRLRDTVEGKRVFDAAAVRPWRVWGPYLAERQWGTVREDYSAGGDAWSYLSFDVTIEYAKAAGDDVLMRVTAVNRGPDAATLHVLPHLWSANSWSWTEDAARPLLKQSPDGSVLATHPDIPPMRLNVEGSPEILF